MGIVQTDSEKGSRITVADHFAPPPFSPCVTDWPLLKSWVLGDLVPVTNCQWTTKVCESNKPFLRNCGTNRHKTPCEFNVSQNLFVLVICFHHLCYSLSWKPTVACVCVTLKTHFSATGVKLPVYMYMWLVHWGTLYMFDLWFRPYLVISRRMLILWIFPKRDHVSTQESGRKGIGKINLIFFFRPKQEWARSFSFSRANTVAQIDSAMLLEKRFFFDENFFCQKIGTKSSIPNRIHVFILPKHMQLPYVIWNVTNFTFEENEQWLFQSFSDAVSCFADSSVLV